MYTRLGKPDHPHRIELSDTECKVTQFYGVFDVTICYRFEIARRQAWGNALNSASPFATLHSNGKPGIDYRGIHRFSLDLRKVRPSGVKITVFEAFGTLRTPYTPMRFRPEKFSKLLETSSVGLLQSAKLHQAKKSFTRMVLPNARFAFSVSSWTSRSTVALSLSQSNPSFA